MCNLLHNSLPEKAILLQLHVMTEHCVQRHTHTHTHTYIYIYIYIYIMYLYHHDFLCYLSFFILYCVFTCLLCILFKHLVRGIFALLFIQIKLINAFIFINIYI